MSPDFNQTLEDINESMNHINEENLDEFDKSIMDDQNLDDAIESLHNELVINNNKIDYVEDLVNKRNGITICFQQINILRIMIKPQE